MKTAFVGPLRKMRFRNLGSELLIKPNYYLPSNDSEFDVNSAIGKQLSIAYTGIINCVSCGRVTKKSFGQGYCYPCFISVPQTEECVLRPELCRAHEGIARNLDYAKENCLVDQYVYLALSGGLKVGVTRFHQIPDRWIDQGATYAIRLAVAKNRYNAGLIEIALKKILADKTNWRKMLMGNDQEVDLILEKNRALEYIHNQEIEFVVPDNSIFRVDFPVTKFPLKVVSKDLEKEQNVSGLLSGIKGQYLIFEGGAVLNIRKHSGYNVEISVG